ncbi:hypothetical protein [Anaerocolumna jejuensis]|uniref:hypothetical protein n=1 Tax=Anaerocolumna jejuensis TaxID=259063 RepID=UPI003F7B9F1F
MEKNITGKNPSPDRDDMELKGHLEASFERDNITVSEDLIQRTLLKIKEAEGSGRDSEHTSGKTKNEKRFPAFRFAGAAAAILLLITAVWIYQNSMTGSKTNNGLVNDKISYGIESAQSADPSLTADANTERSADKKITAAEGGAGSAADQSAGTEEKSSSLTGQADEEAGTKSDMKIMMKAPQVLSELYTIDTKDIQSFILQREKEKDRKMSIESVGKFYSLLTNYTVQSTDKKAPESYIYCFVITGKEKKTITFEFYQDSLVNVTDKRTEEGTVTYAIDNGEELLSKLQNLIKE